MRQNVDDYVDEYFKRGMYLNSYYLAIEPINGRSMWPEVSGDPIHPPPFKKMPGRPKISRKKSIDEIRTDPKDPTKLSRHGIRMKCTICNEYGHNKRGCHKKDNPPQQSENPPHQQSEQPPPQQSELAPQQVLSMVITIVNGLVKYSICC